MTVYVPAIVICPEAQADALSKVFDAMGRGPGSFIWGRMVCAKDPDATQQTPPTHRLIQDMTAPAEIEDMWRKMSNGIAMPQIVWSALEEERGIVITEAEAVAAALSMSVFSVTGPLGEQITAEAILDGLGLQFVPGPEI